MHQFFKLSSLLVLAACVSPERVTQIAENDAAIFEKPCDAPASKTCAFINSPVPLKPEPVKLFARRNTFFPTAQPLEFVDARGKIWVAPESTLTDGASIPPIFVPIIGFPNSPEFANAAVLHDAYCGIGNERGQRYHSTTWQKTHRMFYDALRVGGTSEIKSKIMFAAVYLGGPRWTGFRTKAVNPKTHARRITRRSHIDRPLLQMGLTPDQLRQLFLEVRAQIENTNPTIQELEFYIANAEAEAIKAARQLTEEDPAPQGNTSNGCTPYTPPYPGYPTGYPGGTCP